MSFLSYKDNYYLDSDIIKNKSTIKLSCGNIIDYIQYIPPNKVNIKNIFIVVNDFENDSFLKNKILSFELAKKGISTIHVNYRKNISFCINDIYESYILFSKHYDSIKVPKSDINILTKSINNNISCKIGLIGFGLGSFIIMNLIDKNNQYNLDPNLVVLLSPISNPYERLNIFTNNINNINNTNNTKEIDSKNKYHCKDYQNIIDCDTKIFGSNRNIRFQSKYIKKFNSNCQIISIFYKNDIYSTIEMNKHLYDNSSVFMFENDYNLTDLICELIHEISSCRFIFKNKN
jgi:hypothetical protein